MSGHLASVDRMATTHTHPPLQLPRLTAHDADLLAADLAADVDVWQDWTTADGSDVEVRLSVVPDDADVTEMINGADAWGRLEWVRPRTGVSYFVDPLIPRPATFDGNSEILVRGYDYRYHAAWWQPPADVPRTSEHFAAVRQSVLDLLEWGFVGYVVDVRATVDTPYGPRTVDVASASLWGIDTRDPRDYVEAVTDLLAECFDVDAVGE